MDKQAIKRFFEDKGYRVWSGNYGLDVGRIKIEEEPYEGMHMAERYCRINSENSKIQVEYFDYGMMPIVEFDRFEDATAFILEKFPLPSEER